MAITAGLTLACADRSGGLKNLWLANADDVTSFTLTGDDYSAVTMVGVTTFYKFEFEQDTAELRENVVRENGSTQATHEVEIFIPKLTSANRAAIEEIINTSSCGMVGIAETADGTKFVVGYSENFTTDRPLKLLSDTTTSGKALTDLTGATVIVQSIDNEKARVFTGTVPV